MNTKSLLKNNRASIQHEKLNKEIKRLLFLNPTMDFKIILRTLCSLPELTITEKNEWVKTLKKRRLEFIKDAMKAPSIIIDCVKDHFKSWNQFVEPVSLDDIRTIISGTKIPFLEVAGDLINPLEISRMLNNYLIGQERYSQKLALCFYLHHLRIHNKEKDIPKANLLAYGPSGVGKTFGPQMLAKLLGVQFGVVNCNSLVQEGIIGTCITDVFDEIYTKAGNKISEVEKSVVLFDEFDKLFSNGHFNERILNEFLNVIDDDNTVSFRHGHYDVIRISTKNILFIFSGVFSGLEDIVAKRLNTRGIGFGIEKNKLVKHENFHQEVNEIDFAEYFKRDELSGRINQYVYVDKISESTMVDILLKSKDSPVNYFKNYFGVRDIQLDITHDGAEAIAQYAYKKNLGVRGLKSTLFKVLDYDMFLLSKDNIVIDKNYVEEIIYPTPNLP